MVVVGLIVVVVVGLIVVVVVVGLIVVVVVGLIVVVGLLVVVVVVGLIVVVRVDWDYSCCCYSTSTRKLVERSHAASACRCVCMYMRH